MEYSRIYLAIGALALASLSCQALIGGGSRDADDVPSSNDNNSNSESTVSPNFPMTADAFNTVEVGDDSILYYTKLSAEEAMQFYRDEYTRRGYKERKVATTLSDGIFNMVFDGDPSGKAIVIQSVDMGDGSRTIAIRLEDV